MRLNGQPNPLERSAPPMAPDITPEVLAYELDRFTKFLNNTPDAVFQAHPRAMAVLGVRHSLRMIAGLPALPAVDLPR
jgi:hypothetical protein